MMFRHSVPILFSSDVSKSIEYYTEVLGFDSKWEWEDPPTFGGVSKNSVEIFFCKNGQGRPGTWIAVMVDDVDEYYERIKLKGAKILFPPEDKEWHLREMLVQDPDEHVLRFGQHVTPHKKKSTIFPATIKIIERLPTSEEYNSLAKSVGWNVQNDLQVEMILKSPVYALVAEDSGTGNVVGCVLLLSDNASFYYIKDVMVHPDFQAKQIGSSLMGKLNEWIETNAPSEALVGLYTGPNLTSFYGRFGFRESFGMTKRTPAKKTD
jgi:GNAT superfamily N-acetyltransferase/catechol 2,3-dioxygenase-like lactoylglutathione lyase family enzyme